MRAAAVAILLSLTLPYPAAAEDAEAAPNLVILQGLDKITARVSEVEVPLNGTGQFGSLRIVPQYCHRSAPDEAPERAAFLEITEVKPNELPQLVFRGWMFSSSPGLSALEHPVYDISVIDCRTAAPPAAAEETDSSTE